MKILNFKTVVIGGGPAGSAAALFLREAGEEVCVIEMKEFPRETICGEFISGEVSGYLERLDLTERFLSYEPNRIKKFKFIEPGGKTAGAELGFTGFGMRRSDFDSFLLQAVMERGGAVLQPVKVYSIERRGDVFKIEAEGEEKLQITAGEVIAAYGKQNYLDKSLRREFTYIKSGYNGVKFHVGSEYLNGFDPEEIRIYGGANIYCGVNKVNNNLVTLCLLEQSRLRSGGTKEQIKILTQENEEFGKLLRGELKVIINILPVYGTGNIYFGNRNLVENGIYMAGDCGRVIAPLAGDGMGIAFESAEIAAGAVIKRNREPLSREEGEQYFKNEWNKRLRKRLITAMAVQKIIMNNKLRGAGLFAARNSGMIMRYIIKNTRT